MPEGTPEKARGPMGHRTAVALAIVVPVLGAATWASASDDRPDPIRACVERHSGQVRILSGHDDCRPNERALVWNTTGPQGPAGPAGAIGVPGLAGATGLTGPTGPGGAIGAAGPQ